MNLRDFESIRLYFSEEDIDELQAGIIKRRTERLACDGRDHRASEEDPNYSPNLVENIHPSDNHPSEAYTAEGREDCQHVR